MNINELIAIVKKKLETQIDIQNINIEDKSFLHKGHKGNQENKFHLKISIKSSDLSKLSKLESNRKIYAILQKEVREQIHSLQILIL
tara:strand:+ start:100 stop:360 length:261 start_codon:yes stop_codon:yes gene_type:complete